MKASVNLLSPQSREAAKNHKSLSRREWMLAVAGASLEPVEVSTQPEKANYRTFFGDLHNHNAVGYAQGSLARTFEIARNHLDFFAFTPHGHWHDIGRYENNIEERWIKGFAITRARWPEVLEFARKFDDPGRFVAIVGYEWHSTGFGDYHIIFPDLVAEYAPMDDLRAFQKFARARGCLLIPHHPANRPGNVSSPLPHFVETFPDDGYLDMYRVMKALRQVRFSGTVVPDHVPQLAGDEGIRRAGTAYCIAYMRALLRRANQEVG